MVFLRMKSDNFDQVAIDLAALLNRPEGQSHTLEFRVKDQEKFSLLLLKLQEMTAITRPTHLAFFPLLPSTASSSDFQSFQDSHFFESPQSSPSHIIRYSISPTTPAGHLGRFFFDSLDVARTPRLGEGPNSPGIFDRCKRVGGYYWCKSFRQKYGFT